MVVVGCQSGSGGVFCELTAVGIAIALEPDLTLFTSLAVYSQPRNMVCSSSLNDLTKIVLSLIMPPCSMVQWYSGGAVVE